MCNLYTQSRSVDEVKAIFAAAQMPLSFPEGAPNLEQRDIAITDPGPIVRVAADDNLELVVRRWSWPMANGKPLYNFRSEGRRFPSGRCLVIADGFYEYTTPTDPKQKRKDRWLFSAADGGLIAIAGTVRNSADVGEAYTLLTGEPGPDVAPYHGRQIVVLPPSKWAAWLHHQAPEADLLRPTPAGTLTVKSAMRAG